MRSASKTLLTTINTQGSTLTTTMVTLGRQPVTGPEVISGQCMQRPKEWPQLVLELRQLQAESWVPYVE